MTLQPFALPPPDANLLDQASLFLDFDGTLVDLASRPDAVAVEVRLHALMARLSAKLDGRVAIVSGRSAAQVRELFGTPTFVIAGSHGHELHWPDGKLSAHTPGAHHDMILGQMGQLQQSHPGLMVEDKPYGVALHYRLAPSAESECLRLAERLAETTGYTLQTGKKVVELKATGADKGDAVRSLMGSAPMAGARPVFVGDDDTDEAGFQAARDLGGAGVLVGPPRATAAAYRLPGVEETLKWLEAASGAAR